MPDHPRSARGAQSSWGCLALATALVVTLDAGVGCVSPSTYGVRGHYQGPEPPAPLMPEPLLISAHVSAFGDEPARVDEPHLVDAGEPTQDRILLVFARELDPLTIDPRAFGVIRADGRRVRPKRAFLAPADEGDENRSLTLLGNFGAEDTPPVAVHVISGLHAESGEELGGLDAQITPLSEPDRALIVERLTPSSSRCPEARQVIRSYWSDALTAVGAADLAGVELHLADGRIIAPIDFDDQATREDDGEPGPGRPDDNVLDLCVDVDEAVVHVRFGAGIFADPGGRPTAAADLSLAAIPPVKTPKPKPRSSTPKS